ncbi:PREDICTED: TLR4 interactor with leucine rich repeats [Crocodylus porosus]|uniref:TLR4 interactor with leucine rich repeats n=1 Tax=Crocodylus porosus TaxID=8502 RepID=UPI00093BBAF4|nr:PREDICTED: TLR4 interactor with leucine rich repeats [Crocodylus porosus]
MEPRRGSCLMLLQLLLLLLLLPPAARPLCPEPCDCQQERHVVCTNRGLRAVPRPPAAAQDVLTYSLGGNFIANVSAADFQRLVGLQRLDLQYNRIRWLQPAAFERLGRLEELYLGNNLLAALPPGALGGLARLRILYVNANQLRRLSAAAFTGLASLVKLRLDGNALGALGEAGFAGLPNLLYLHLESNRIRWLGRGAFAGLAKLRFLDLSGNPQRALRQPAAFAPLRSLHTLLLGSNRLQRLGGAPFRHLPGLATLSLSGNRLAHLAPDAFTGLAALTELRLEGNALSRLPAGLLEPLRSLQALDLSRNALRALPPLGRLPRLRDLPAAPLVSDPCDFNKRFLRNLSVEAVGASAASLRWAVRPHRSPRLLGPARFRLLFDRFGASAPFPRFVELPERSEPAATLRDLRPDTPYLVCVEAVLGGRACPVAPRDRCAGLVTLPDSGAAAGPDAQLLTLVLLALNALLLVAALAAWASRLVRRKVLGRRRRKAAPVHVRHVYSTRRPLRSTGTGVSADFSGFQAPRPSRSAAAACALSEADLMDFPCERFLDSGGVSARHGDEHLLQRFAD